MTLETVDAPEGAGVTLSTDAIARCPVESGVDRYDLEVRIVSAGQSVECQSLQDYIDGFADVELSQEEVAGRIYDAVTDAVPDATVRVVVSGGHAGVETEVQLP